MKWTTKQPKVDGYYWFKEREYLLATATEPRKATGAYCTPRVVRVNLYVDEYNRPDGGGGEVLFFENEKMELDDADGLWAGPIPPPEG